MNTDSNSGLEIVDHIERFISDSNKCFEVNDLVKAAAFAEKAYSLAKNYENCSIQALKKIEFNLATIYASSKKFDLAKGWLDCVKDNEICFTKEKEIAILYHMIGDNFKSNTNQMNKRIECYESAAIYYAKSKEWHSYCQVEMIHARLLNALNLIKEGNKVAGKILSACFRLNESVELAKIYNDVATIFGQDTENEANMYLARRLLSKALNLVKKSNEPNVKLEVSIYQNMSAVNNRLGKFNDSLKCVKLAFELIDSIQDDFLYSDLKFNEGFAHAHLKEYKEALNAFEMSHKYALKTKQNNLWESQEALGVIYSILNDDERAKSYYERAIKEFYEYCKVSSVKISKKTENRLLSRMKRLGSVNQELIGFNIDLEVDEIEKKDKFNFDGINDKYIDTDSNLISISKKKITLENSEIETLTSEKVTDIKSLNKDQTELKDPTLKLNSNFKENLEQKFIESPSILETKTFKSKEIVEEIDTCKKITFPAKDNMTSDPNKEETMKIQETIKTEHNHQNLKLIAKEAIETKNISQINTEPNEKSEIAIFQKQSPVNTTTIEDDLKNTSEYVNQLQEDYKNILWEKEKMDEERDELERKNGIEITQSEDKKSIETSTHLNEEISNEQLNKPIISDPLKKLVPNTSALKNLDQITSEPQINKISTQSDVISSINETANSSTANESKSSNTFTIKKKRFYRDFNRGSLRNHPEDREPKKIQEPQKKSKICTIS